MLLLSPDGTVALVFRGGGFEVVETASGKTVAIRTTEPLREERDYIPEEGRSARRPAPAHELGLDRPPVDATTGEPIAVLGRPDDEIGAFAFGDGGRLVLATFSDRAAEFSAADGTLRSSVAGSFGRGDISSNGAFAAAPLTRRRRRCETSPRAPVQLQTGTGISLASALRADCRRDRGSGRRATSTSCDARSAPRRRAAGACALSAGGARADRSEAPAGRRHQPGWRRLHRLPGPGGGPRSPASPASRTRVDPGAPRLCRPRAAADPSAQLDAATITAGDGTSASSRSPGRAGQGTAPGLNTVAAAQRRPAPAGRSGGRRRHG